MDLNMSVWKDLSLRYFLPFQITPCMFSLLLICQRNTLGTYLVAVQFCKHLWRCGTICPVWNPSRLFNGRLALTHHRDQARHMFYDLVNEQRCCETCVCLSPGGWAVGCGDLVSDRDLSATHTQTLHPFCLDGRALPREPCRTDRNLSPDFQRFSHIPYTRKFWDGCLGAVCLSHPTSLLL